MHGPQSSSLCHAEKADVLFPLVSALCLGPHVLTNKLYTVQAKKEEKFSFIQSESERTGALIFKSPLCS